jgi:predicted ATPase
MSNWLKRLAVRNFRSLADIDLSMGPLHVLFGPNGAGKTTLLDTIWFIRDCAIRGVDLASSDRSHGIGMRWDGASEESDISITLETNLCIYEVRFAYSSGRIEPFVGERLYSKTDDRTLIDRKIGSDKAEFYHYSWNQHLAVPLKEPEKLALTRYISFEKVSGEASDIERMLRYTHFLNARSLDLFGLKKYGSDSSYQTSLADRGQNLWSVLRNLHDRRARDERYDTIAGFMRDSFPLFKDLYMEQTGPSTVYGYFIEKKLRGPVAASGASDGHIQMLILLTALFAEGPDRESLILFDEPETSLHPHALSVFAKAVKLAVKSWNKQVLMATHSPVLISQFDADDVFAAEIEWPPGKTMLRVVSQIEGIQDLLEQYAAGSLYMAEAIAPQSRTTDEETES